MRYFFLNSIRRFDPLRPFLKIQQNLSKFFSKMFQKSSKNFSNIYWIFSWNLYRISQIFFKILHFPKIFPNVLNSQKTPNFPSIYLPIKIFLYVPNFSKIFLMFRDIFVQIIIEASSIFSSNFFQDHLKYFPKFLEKLPTSLFL